MTLPTWWLSAVSTHPQRDPSLWSSLKTRLDIAKWKPARADGIVVSELFDRSGAYYVLKNPHTHTYLRLSAREFWVWQTLDGARTVQELIVAYFSQHKAFAFGLVVGLVQRLFEKQMLREQPEFILSNLRRELEYRTLWRKLFDPEHGLLTRQFLITRFDDLVAWLYRAGGWIFFTRFIVLISIVLSVIGSLLYLQILGDARFRFTASTLGITVVLLYLVAIIPIVLHELAHALATKHYKREVHRGGLMLYYGLPAAFVDTTDIWLEGTRHRVSVALAGPFASILIASLCSIWLVLTPDAMFAPILFQVASIGFFISLVSLNPALPLDGYYVLSDSLEMTRLRERSFAFFRYKFLPKLLKRESWPRDEIIFLAFGAITAAWTGYSIYIAYIIYRARVMHTALAFFGAPAREVRILALVSFAALALLAIIVLRERIFQFTRHIAVQIRRIERLTHATPLALAIILSAILVTLVPLVLFPEIIEWVDTIIGVVAVTFGLYGALRIGEEMQGTLAARAWQIIAFAIGLVGAAHIFWGLRFTASDPIAVTLDMIALGLATLATILSFPVLIRLRGSWRSATTIIFGLGWLSLLGTLASNENFPGVALHLLPVLLLLGGVLHWQMAHPSVLVASLAPTHALTTNEQLHRAFCSLSASVLEQLQMSFGDPNAARVISRFNVLARERDWGMEIVKGNVNFALPNSLSAIDFADLVAAALSSLLNFSVHTAGEKFARAAIARAYDSLSWDEREVIAENVLAQTRYAEGLAEQFAQAQQDVSIVLKRAPLFVDFTREELRAVSERLKMEHFARGDVIIRQGDPGDRFYIIRRGHVHVMQSDSYGYERMVNQLGSGDYFGEAALLTGAPRNATIRALTSVSTFTLSKQAFDQLVRADFRGRDKMDTATRRVGLLRGIPVFSDFDSLELRRVVGQLESKLVQSGQKIFEQGDLGDRFYIIESGQVGVETIAADGQKIEQARLGAGEYFGEIALLMNVPRTATITVLEPTQLLILEADAFNDLVRQSQNVSRSLERTSSRRLLLLAQMERSRHQDS